MPSCCPAARLPGSLALVAIAAGLTACGLQISPRVESRDQWTRTYTVKPDGELEVQSPNGRIAVQSADSPQIEVTATRIVRAATEEAAKGALHDLTMGEQASADRVSIDAGAQTLGFTINVSRQVDFDVKVPRGVRVILKTANGDITAAGVRALRAKTSNGDISATALGGPAEIETVNGSIDLAVARLDAGGLRCETTNGRVTIALPADVTARVSLRATNGGIDTGGLAITSSESTRSRVEGTINGGGPTILVKTLNGSIRLRRSPS